MDLLRIGQFSRLAQIPVTTLRHWDELGVLVPAATDPRSGYRYYRSSQLAVATTVRLLRGLEVPLDEVARLLAADVDVVVEAVRAHAGRLARRAETQQLVARFLLDRVTHPQEPIMDVTVVDRPDQPVLARRREIAVRELSPWLTETFSDLLAVARHRGLVVAGPPLTVFHRPADDERDGEVEACLPVMARGDRVLRGGPAAALDARGERATYPRLVGCYEQLAAWVAEHDGVLGDPPYEVYRSGPEAPVDERCVQVFWPLAEGGAPGQPPT